MNNIHELCVMNKYIKINNECIEFNERFQTKQKLTKIFIITVNGFIDSIKIFIQLINLWLGIVPSYEQLVSLLTSTCVAQAYPNWLSVVSTIPAGERRPKFESQRWMILADVFFNSKI